MNNLKNKIVLITGAGRGIGKRLAMGFAKLGSHVALLGRDAGELDAGCLVRAKEALHPKKMRANQSKTTVLFR